MPFFYLDLEENEQESRQQIYYSDSGRGKHILLFVCGWFLTHEVFSFYTKNLQEKYRVIALDLPGHGQSSQDIYDEYSMRTAFRAVSQLAVKLKDEGSSLTLVGYSLGSFLSLKLSLFSPKLVDQLVLISPLIDFKTFEKKSKYLAKLDKFFLSLRLLFRAVWGKFPFNDLTQSHYPLSKITLYLRIKTFLQLRQNQPLHVVRQYLFSFRSIGLESLINNNNKHTLIVYGANDSFLRRADLDTHMRYMSHARLHVIEDAAHNVLMTHSQQILSLLHEFMQENQKRKYGWLRILSERL